VKTVRNKFHSLTCYRGVARIFAAGQAIPIPMKVAWRFPLPWHPWEFPK